MVGIRGSTVKLFVLKEHQPLERAAQPNVAGTYDIIVVGLGSAGAPCALEAAKSGLSVLGIERWNGMGGQATLGCVNFGADDAIEVALAQYEQEAKDCGLRREMMSTVIGVWMDGRRVVGVRSLHNGFVSDFMARIVIDASGNGTVARAAGCGMCIGRDSDHGQAAISKTLRYRQKDGRIRPGYGFFRDNPLCDVDRSSRTVLRCAVADFKRWSGRTVVRRSPMMGAREEGHVVCEDTYTLRDAICGRSVPDPVCRAFAPFDLVRIDGDWAWENEDTVDWKEICGLHDFAFKASIPYGTIVPKGVDGLLVPSKHYGVAHDAGGGLRMQNHMRCLGVAAAQAARLSIQKGVPLRSVPYSELSKALPPRFLSDPRRSVDTVNVIHHNFTMEPFDAARIEKALSQPYAATADWVKRSERGPGQDMAWAYFSCWRTYLCGEPRTRRSLADFLAARLDGEWGGHFAIALGLMRDPRAVAGLRALAFAANAAWEDRVKALAALGRYDDPSLLKPFMEVVLDDARRFCIGYPDEKGRSFARMTMAYRRFQALSYILFSVRRILQKRPDANVLRSLADWSARPLELKCGARDNADLGPQLKTILNGLI